MGQAKVNFDVDEGLKDNFEVAIKKMGFSHMAEAFRDFMRSTVREMKSSSDSHILQNQASTSQG